MTISPESSPGVVNECALLGHNDLPKLTFPGQNPDRTFSAVPSVPSSTASPSSTSQTIVSAVPTTPPPYQSTVTALPTTSSASAQSTSVPSLGIRSAQSSKPGFVLAVTVMMMALVEIFSLGQLGVGRCNI